MLGISVYLQDIDFEYIEQAARCGVKLVFTSLQMQEEDYNVLSHRLPDLLDCCTKLGLHVIADISAATFKKLKLAENDFDSLKRLGINTLRLNEFYNDASLIKKLLINFDLMLNASFINEETIKKAIQAGVSFEHITLSYNFYPHRNTGLDFLHFKENIRKLHSYNLRFQVFVCGDEVKRFPFYEGLPTLEKHRTMHPLAAAAELIEICGIQDIIIGDTKAKIDTLTMIHQFMTDRTLCIKAHFEPGYEYFYEQTYSCRMDTSEHVIRINAALKSEVPIYHSTRRPCGSITMDNCLYGRYCGEVQIMKKDMDMDARCNVIGYIHPEFIDLLTILNPKMKIKFEPFR